MSKTRAGAVSRVVRWLAGPPGVRALFWQSVLYVVCLGLFALRRSRFGVEVLDARTGGYGADEVDQLFGKLQEGGHLVGYALSELTLDLLFPVVYSLFFGSLLARLWPASHARWKGLFLAAPFLVAVLDWAENLSIGFLALTFDGGVNPAWTAVASGLTVLKVWAFAVVVLVLLGLVVYRVLFGPAAEQPAMTSVDMPTEAPAVRAAPLRVEEAGAGATPSEERPPEERPPEETSPEETLPVAGVTRLRALADRFLPVQWEALLVVWLLVGFVARADVIVVTTLLLLLWAGYLQAKSVYLSQYIFYLRFPLLAAILLVALPVLAEGPASSLLRNLFVLERPGQALVASLVATLLAMTIMSTMRLLYLTAPARVELPFSRELTKVLRRMGESDWQERADARGLVDMEEARLECLIEANRMFLGVGEDQEEHSRFQVVAASAVRWRWLLFGLLALPFLGVVLYESHGARGWFWGAFELLVGWVLGMVLAWLARTWARRRKKQREMRTKSREPTSRLATWPVGYGSQGHVAAAVWAFFVLVVYAVLGWMFSPLNAADAVDWLPAVCYVFLISTVVTLLLSMVSLPFDKWRVAAVPAIAVAVLLLFGVFQPDHRYEVVPKSSGWGELPTAPKVVEAWRGRNPDARTMTVVAASGGGIKAALWTGRVLEQMSAARPDLLQSIVLVSSTSGGSVGALYFQEAFTAAGAPAPEALAKAREAAGRSSLAASVWGLAYPDLWRILSGGAFPWGDWRTRDRGWALDRRWEQRRLELAEPLGEAKPRHLGDWVSGVQGGWRPAQVFNATVAESGAAMRIATVDLSEVNAAGAPGSVAREFSDLYPWTDIEVVTAARLSATFPWISPMSRPWMQEENLDALVAELEATAGDDPPDPASLNRLRKLNADQAFRLADGGYFDNFGIESAIEFLDDVGPRALRETFGIDRVLVVEIRASGEKLAQEKRGGLVYSLVGPIVTMNKVRTSSQIGRNDHQLENLRDLWAQDAVSLCRVVFTMKTPGPLSWQLSKNEAQAVVDAWGSGDEDEKMADVGRFLDFESSSDVVERRPSCATWEL